METLIDKEILAKLIGASSINKIKLSPKGVILDYEPTTTTTNKSSTCYGEGCVNAEQERRETYPTKERSQNVNKGISREETNRRRAIQRTVRTVSMILLDVYDRTDNYEVIRLLKEFIRDVKTSLDHPE